MVQVICMYESYQFFVIFIFICLVLGEYILHRDFATIFIG